ncbi:hypothetical protein AK812_SmicGene9889 [Symbiodinium microadriaticum]|uniref:Uncharacterized protein n=1 Tax=Symbiodinium microadriaticum TaxID=2951 RepID=A0A1Q9EH88_SYMMI|nr:hypothetical protein AK812_SmicGene9889 [Symbiodinium microadriaticum]
MSSAWTVIAATLLRWSCGYHPVDDIVGVWTTPPKQVPSKGLPDGPLIGNGDLGAALAWPTSSPEINIHIGHNAFFAAPVAGTTSCGYAPGGRKALATWIPSAG